MMLYHEMWNQELGWRAENILYFDDFDGMVYHQVSSESSLYKVK